MSRLDTWTPVEVRTYLRQLLRRVERGDCDPVVDMFAWVDKPGTLPAPVDWLRKVQEFGDSLPSEKWNPIIRVEAGLVGEKPRKEIVFGLVTYSAIDPVQRVANLAAIYRFVSEGKVDDVDVDYFALYESWLPQCRIQAIECLSDWIDVLESPSNVRSKPDNSVLDPWVVVAVADCSFNKSTISRHARSAGEPDIEQTGKRGEYRIRKSRLNYYVKPSKLQKYLGE